MGRVFIIGYWYIGYIYNRVRLGSKSVSFIYMLCVLSGCMGVMDVLKCGIEGGMGYVPGVWYVEMGLMFIPCMMGGVAGIIAGAAHRVVVVAGAMGVAAVVVDVV